MIPGCNSPENLTKTDSGTVKGIIPVTPANATRPEPAGKEIPIGNLVCESAPVPTVSGRQSLFNHEWITPSPGRRIKPFLDVQKSGSVC